MDAPSLIRLHLNCSFQQMGLVVCILLTAGGLLMGCNLGAMQLLGLLAFFGPPFALSCRFFGLAFLPPFRSTFFRIWLALGSLRMLDVLQRQGTGGLKKQGRQLPRDI